MTALLLLLAHFPDIASGMHPPPRSQPIGIESLGDLAKTDPALAQSLQWLLETELTPELSDDLAMSFVAPQDEYGWGSDLPLVPGGRDVTVTEENKRAYVAHMCEWKLRSVVQQQLRAFAEGLHDFVPPRLLALFSAEEIGLLISGAPLLDVDDWKAHTTLSDLEPDDNVVNWFWAYVASLAPSEQARLLQFATGSPAVPVGGFAHLRSADGAHPFTLSKTATAAPGSLPTAATCFNLLRLPSYPSYDALAQALRTAVDGACEGFAFA